MNTTSQFPSLLNRADLAMIRKVLRNNEIFAKDMWAFGNTLQMQLDQHGQAIETIQERLWSLEVRRRAHAKQAIPVSVCPRITRH